MDQDFKLDLLTDEITERFFEAAHKENAEQEGRTYLGASIIGHPCLRRLYYSWTAGSVPVEGRVALIFKVGHALEDLVINTLRKAGYEVDGQQLGFSDFDERFKGHADGIVKNLIQTEDGKFHDAILEVKTANDRKFKLFQKNTVVKTDANYKAQAHVYMHYFKKQYCLFAVINKNNCDIYFEVVEYDEEIAQEMRQKAQFIFNAKSEPPIPEGFNQDCFECMYCSYNSACYGARDLPF